MTKRRHGLPRTDATPRRPARVRETPYESRTQSSGVCYVESSALTAAVMEGEQTVLAALLSARRRVSSVLTVAETARAIVRARVAGRITRDQEATATRSLQAFAATTNFSPMSADVLKRVGRPFPVEPVRTLDAIHLATLELLGELPHTITVLTRDARVRENALAMGYRVA